MDRGRIVAFRLFAPPTGGDFRGDREALQPGKFLVHGAADGAGDNLLKLRTNRRRQRGCEMLDDCFGAFFRRHGQTVVGRSTIQARKNTALSPRTPNAMVRSWSAF